MRSVSVGTAVGGFSLSEGFSWPDPDIEGTLVISQPSIDPELWADYTAGAVRSYSKRGVECALDIEALRSGDDTIMFGAVVNDSGRVVGGYRAIALRSADDSHAVEEWAGRPGQQDVRQMIADDTCGDIGRTAGRERDDEVDRVVRPFSRHGDRGSEGCERQNNPGKARLHHRR